LPSELKIRFDVKGNALFQTALHLVSEPVLYADDLGVIISNKNVEGSPSLSNLVLCCVIKWSAASELVTNLDKTNVLKFITNNTSHSTLYIGYKVKYIEETVNTKFLGLHTDNHINWKNHIEQMIPHLSAVRYAVRSTVHISNINTLKSIYYCIMSIWYKTWKTFWG
jgi:hypothetical protein